MNEERSLVGSRIREERKALGINQEKLAEMTKIDTTVLSRIERGERGINSIQLRRISEALDVDMDRFFEPANDGVLALAREGGGAMAEMIEYGRSLLRDMEFIETCRE